MKKLFSLLLAIILPAVAGAYDAEIDGIYYNFDTTAKTATVTYYSSGNDYDDNQDAYSGTVNIPPTVDYGGETYDVTSIGGYAFWGCSGLTSVTIPDCVTSIGEQAFLGCSGLTSITIPNTVTSIGGQAFLGCGGLTSVTIPNGVASIGAQAFFCSGLTSVTILDGVTSIGEAAFDGCPGLTSVTFHCKEIGKWFYGLKSINEIIIGDEVTSIGAEAFCYCSGLTSVTIPGSVTSIGSGTFSYCSGLTSVTIPDGVTSIGERAFQGCSGLTSIKVESGNQVYDSRNNCNAIIKTESNELICGCMNTAIPNSVTSIGNYAFSHCSSLTSVTIPNSVTSIGDLAFSGCSGLTSVTIQNSVTSIGYGAFDGCSGITLVKVPVTDYASFCENKIVGLISSNIGKPVQLIDGDATEIKEYVVPDGVASIGSSAFRNCTGLTSVTIPGSVTNIGNNAFSGCSGITLVKVPVTDYASFCENKIVGLISSNIGKPVQLIDGDATEIKEYVVPDGVASIGSSAFRNCTGLTSVTISNSVTSIGGYAFYGCSGLTSVTIPNSVTSIEGSAFSDCSSLSSVTIGSGVTSIGGDAFKGCTSLTTVKSYIEEPFNISKFENDTYRQGTLYVPKGTKDLYIRFDGWREFLKIEEMEKEPAPNGQCATPAIIVLGSRFKFQCETPGAEFTSSLTTEENFTGDEVVMDNDKITYTLTVYATAPGYDQSSPAKYRFAINKKDVNQDGNIDVADIATVIDAMAAQAREQKDMEE